jgi:hypothetical protein
LTTNWLSGSITWEDISDPRGKSWEIPEISMEVQWDNHRQKWGIFH